MRKATLLGVLALLFLLCVTPVYADGIPALPHAFYGTVLVNGSPAPIGTSIEARGLGVTTGIEDNPLFTTAVGVYGSSDPFAHRLLVQGDIQDGATITFYVNGVSTGQTAIWHSGQTTQISLAVTIVAPISPGGGGGGGIITTTVVTNFFGTQSSFKVDSSGIIQETFTATSSDGKLTITIPKDTKCLDKDGNPLTSLTGTVVSPPAPPENANIIGLAYNFLPAGATFVPPIIFEFTVSPDEIIPPLTVDDLVGAYYDETSTPPGWVDLPTSVVPGTTYILKFSVSHFTTFAIIGTPKPAAFTLSSLVVSPVQVAPGEKVDISLSVANSGGTAGSYTVVLNINGVKEAEKSVTVAAGSIQTVNFSVTKANAGSYSVTVGGLSGSFTVIAPPAPPTTTPPATTPPVIAPPTTAPTTTTLPPVPTPPPAPSNHWPLIGGIIGGVVVIALIILLFSRRRD